MLKRITSIFTALSLMMCAGHMSVTAVPMTEINRNKAAIKAVTAYAAGGLYTATYTNNVDGYRVTVPSGLTPDNTLSHIRFKLSSPTDSIEIYKESFESRAECESYIAYSNRFKNDRASHNVRLDQQQWINGRRVWVLAWDRESLGPGDRNHYVNIDIVDNTNVYTITIKSSGEISYWHDVAQSFTVIKPTASAVSQPFPSSPNSGKDEETAKFMDRVFSEDSGLDWGLFIPMHPDYGMGSYELIEEEIGTELEMSLIYCSLTAYDSHFIHGSLDMAWNAGKVTELTLQLPLDVSGATVYDILLGKYDSCIDSLIADVKNFGHPVLMRLFNEMNGDWCNYSSFYTSRDPDVYIRLYRYVVDKFRAAGVNNVIWIWNPNEKSYPNFLWNSEELYYPGSDYVDVVGLTGYNTGTYYASVGEKWRTFDEIYSDIYTKALLLYNKPLMITEFSCSSIGGDKLAWVKDMFESLPDYPMIKAAIWWGGCDYDPSNGNVSRPYYIDDIEGVVDEFRKHLAGSNE